MELPTRHKIDVAAFYRMGEAGIIAEHDRIELIDGELIDMAPIGDDHAGTVNVLTEILVLACVGRAIVSVQNPVRLGEHDMPQPDFGIYRRREDYYRTGGHARPSDVLLLIEVSDTTLRYDRTVKLGLYARSGVPEYWIVDLQHRAVIIHRQPSGGSYADVTTLTTATHVALAAAMDITVDLHRILG